MNFEEWEPYYDEILRDFGYSREKDRESAELLVELSGGKRLSASDARDLVEGRRVTVVGDAPSLSGELRRRHPRGAVLAADGAASKLMARGLIPDIIATDLDGDPAKLPEAEEKGSMLAVHAHGDNRHLIEAWIPMFEGVLPTCQCRPFDGLYNFGGFTDGDRAAFMADELGAAEIDLMAFDFEAYDDELKGRKLRWAERLLSTLELDDLG